MVVNASINSSHDHIQYSNSSNDSLSSNTITTSGLSDYENVSAINCDTKINSLPTSPLSSKALSPSPYSFRKRSNQNSNSSSPLKNKSSLSSDLMETITTDITQINTFENDGSLTSNQSIDIFPKVVLTNENGRTENGEVYKVEPTQNEANPPSQGILPSKRRSCTPASFNIKQMFQYKFTANVKPKRSKSRLKDQPIKVENVVNGESLESNSKRSRQIEKGLPNLTVTTTNVKDNLSIDLPSPISPRPTIKAANLNQILNTTPPSKVYKHSSQQCPHNREWCRPNPYLYPWEQRSQKLSATARRALFFKSSFNGSNESGLNSTTRPEATKPPVKRTSMKKNNNAILSTTSSSNDILHEPHYFGYRMTRDGKKEFLVTWESDEDR